MHVEIRCKVDAGVLPQPIDKVQGCTRIYQCACSGYEEKTNDSRSVACHTQELEAEPSTHV